MIQSKIFDNGKAYCGRTGCTYQLGRVDRLGHADGTTETRLFLSSRWLYHDDAAPPRWRHDGRNRRGFPREEPPRTMTLLFGSRREQATELPAVIECARCRIVQEVPRG